MEVKVEFDEQAKEALELLLHHFWILRTTNPDAYRRIREREKVVRRYLDDKFGLLLIVHQHFIKLEKIPVEPEPWMGMSEFQETRDYTLFCSAMAFLEGKTVGEQFLLSELTEEIQHNSIGEDSIDWTIYTHRKSLIRALKAMTTLKILVTVDGALHQFDTDQQQEVLYETTVYSKYFIRSFPEDLTSFSNWKDVLASEWGTQQEDERRKRVYRKLFFSPNLQRIALDDPDFAYIRTFRNHLQEDIEAHSHYQLRVFKNTALLTAADPDYRYDYFPDAKAVTDIVLQVSMYLAKNRSDFTPLETGELLLTMGDFERLLADLKVHQGFGWSKEYRETSLEGLRKEMIYTMESWMMAKQTEPALIYLQPLLGLLAGSYPKEFIE
ncbi:uncharacterized protein (TIGR02678 family) [Chryseomicrobium aureum]|nr:TIGR02678 family protein [Chryseomicrobium aureum]MBM7706421.1 uncharacterized protein (TIGR02678 family) [Chryseomicrobium aureum]